jgi:hypothetical protein
MISTKLESSKPSPTDELLGATLDKAHKVWIEETRRFVQPATDPEAPFWTRWTTVRYLADQFLGQYRRERALVEELRAFLAPGRVERLSRDGERIDQLRLALDGLGRRRGTAPKVAAASRALLELLPRWCTEVERAASRLPKRVLPEKATRLVAELETFAQLHV